MEHAKSLSIDFLVQASQNLIPWITGSNEVNLLKTETDNSSQTNLDGYYLFPLTELTVSSESEDVAKFINARYQTILSACYNAGISVALVINSKNGDNSIYLGFNKIDSTENEPELFESIINGVLPGRKVKLQETVCISGLTEGFLHGGMVTGVPMLSNKTEKKEFNISSVIRSLYGKEFTLVIFSNPIRGDQLQQSFFDLINFRDRLHSCSKRTIGEETGTGESVAKNNQRTLGENEQTTKGTSKTKGRNLGGNISEGITTALGTVDNIGGSVSAAPFGIGASVMYMKSILPNMLNSALGVNSSTNWSTTTSESETVGTSSSQTFGTTKTNSEQRSQSISTEQLNGVALELEKIAEQHIERMIKGFHVGFWETSITFATNDKITCDILGGSFIGEISTPNDTLLPPPRMFLDTLRKGQFLFLPKQSSSNIIFPKCLASYITSDELSLISSPPIESLPGYEIKKMPSLALSDLSNEGEIRLGNITDHGNAINNLYVSLSKADLNKHIFVCGLTGSGKTTTVKHILKSLTLNEKIPFLVIESAKRDYRQLLADDAFKEKLNVFTIGDGTVSPIRFNPFYIQKGVHPLVHIDYLKAIFNASFSLYGPMPHIVEKCLHNIYLKNGWNLTTGIHPNFVDMNGEVDESRYNEPEHYYCFPTLTDLKNEIINYINNELEYKGELKDNIRTAIITRLESLCIGSKGLMFNTYDFFPLEKLLTTSTVFEMENLADDDDKAFFVGLILVLISEYRQGYNPAVNPGTYKKGLQHFMVIEEAHRLLKNVGTERGSEMMGNPKGKAVEVFCNVISEMRSLGQGVAVVEQIPTKISPDVIKNTNTKIVHRLVSKDDQSLLAGSLSISNDDALYLNRLSTGYALCHKEGMERPVECAVLNDIKSHAISDHKIQKIMSGCNAEAIHSFGAYELSLLQNITQKEFIVKLFNSLCSIEKYEINKLVSFAEKELHRLFVLNGSYMKFDKKLFADYMTKQIFELLNKGIYCRLEKFPKNMKQTLFEVIEKTNEDKYEKTLSDLKSFWKVTEPKLFISNVVKNLSFKYLIEKNSEFTVENARLTVSSFFLVPDEQFVETIARSVLSQKRGGYD